jgi:hypothetical protein
MNSYFFEQRDKNEEMNLMQIEAMGCDLEMLKELTNFFIECKDPRKNFMNRATKTIITPFGEIYIRNTVRIIEKKVYWSLDIVRVMMKYKRIGLCTKMWQHIENFAPHDIIYVECVLTKEMECFVNKMKCEKVKYSGNSFYKKINK